MIPVAPGIALAPGEILERFVRASGPGGQNVNKVSSAVELRFDAAASPSLPEDVRARLLSRADHRITEAGTIIIQADRFRDQTRNRADALERLVALIAEACRAPVPRKKTKPTYGSKLRRLEGKSKRAGIKAGRGRVRDD